MYDTPEQLLADVGGLDDHGEPVNPRALWVALEGAPAVRLFAADRATPAGEIRLAPGGSAVYHDGQGFWLLSPDEIADLLALTPAQPL